MFRADAQETFDATPLDPNNRFQPIDAYQNIEGWTHFTFPSREGKYSTMEWHWWHFDASDYNVYNQQQKAVYLIKDQTFDRNVDIEKGNFDYLMGCDLDMDYPEVLGELKYWVVIAIEVEMATSMILSCNRIDRSSIDCSKPAATTLMASNTSDFDHPNTIGWTRLI